MAHLDACPTGDQEVTGSIPTRSSNILSDIEIDYEIHCIFYSHSLSSSDSKRAVVSFW